jgi:hypothetical protein
MLKMSNLNKIIAKYGYEFLIPEVSGNYSRIAIARILREHDIIPDTQIFIHRNQAGP